MDCSAQRLLYRQTGAFSRMMTDYLDDAPALRPFYRQRPTLSGVRELIRQRQLIPTNRKALVEHLQEQYQSVPPSATVNRHIGLLLDEDTFTVTTAHQPNLLTGPLYFIYKILHVIRLADTLQREMPQYRFVPVYYMGNEDADFDELSHFSVAGTRYQWQTRQSGAFGRMQLDKDINRMLDAVAGTLGVEPYGAELLDALRACYKVGTTVQQATFAFVHHLFARYGLVVLIPDTPLLKQQFIPVLQEELLEQSSHRIVEQTAAELDNLYKVQAGSRPINLFYFDEDLRERIEWTGNRYQVLHTTLSFTKEEMLQEVAAHPERFSPNVILRGLYQEMLLPNLIFTGGGGELAYWMELQGLFLHYGIPFPLLVLRNSFLLLPEKEQQRLEEWELEAADLFRPAAGLLQELVLRRSQVPLRLDDQLGQLDELYASLQQQASAVDSTLSQHVAALHRQARRR
ncbi:MAG TPA: bacillithiol biosynthesis cysteine-adding enzyme BshC, partial [Lacibacter sp.]|nr:bacillithiol biosynthesis cysteine-adding enzyme BshC [Lacibacter sp.]